VFALQVNNVSDNLFGLPSLDDMSNSLSSILADDNDHGRYSVLFSSKIPELRAVQVLWSLNSARKICIKLQGNAIDRQ